MTETEAEDQAGSGFRLGANHRGALWMLGAATGFTLNSVVVKAAANQGFDPFQIAFFRSWVSLLCVLPLVCYLGPGILRTRLYALHGARIFFGVAAMVCGFFALRALPLADVTALSFTTPLFTTLLAVLFLGETVRWRRWTATFVGFLGVLVMVRPGASSFEPAALLALAMAFGIAMAVVLVKRLPPGESQIAMLFYFGVGATLVTVLPALAAWKTPDPWQLLMLSSTGVLGVCSQAMIIQAFRTGEASFVAPFDYSKLITAGLLGYLLFAEVPDPWALAGAAVIVAATLYIARREAQVGKPPSAKPDPI